MPQLPTASQSGQDLTAHAKAALILDSENDLKSLDRDLRDIEALEKRGIAGAGRLPGEGDVICMHVPANVS